MEELYLVIDIGGTWIKGTIVSMANYLEFKKKPSDDLLKKLIIKVERIQSPFHKEATVNDLIYSINKLVEKLVLGQHQIRGIGISTTGIVNYHGTNIVKAAEHLDLLKQDGWKDLLEIHYSCKVILINDADASAIGMAELGYLFGDKTIGVMVVGTGLGFMVWRNGRRWRPGGSLTLLGSIRTPVGFYDEIASAQKLALNGESANLIEILVSPKYNQVLGLYNENLAQIIITAAVLYNIDEVYLSGGLIEAARTVNYNFYEELNHFLISAPSELNKPVKLKIIDEGNQLQLLGAIALIIGETIAQECKQIPAYDKIQTEIPYDEHLMLQRKSATEIVEVLWKAEEESGKNLSNSLSIIADIADKIANAILNKGRIIYIGAGTSGRLAAMDAIEIPGTYGLPKDKILTVIAGGIADATIDIETDFEEDASSLPEMLLLNIRDNDVVIGISASGSAYFVQSALAFSKFRGAYTVMIQNADSKSALSFCHIVIPLHAAFEVVAGSTRMNAGTSTKKVLNFLTTTAMIRLGKVYGPYMTDVECINNKLKFRAKSILRKLFDLSYEESEKILEENNYCLKKICLTIPCRRGESL